MVKIQEEEEEVKVELKISSVRKNTFAKKIFFVSTKSPSSGSEYYNDGCKHVVFHASCCSCCCCGFICCLRVSACSTCRGFAGLLNFWTSKI